MKNSTLVAAAMMLAVSNGSLMRGPVQLPDPEPERDPELDRQRLDAAQRKRDRKAAKRLEGKEG